MANGERNPADWVKVFSATAVAIILIFICLIVATV
jgi:hypothetical protein